MSPGRLPLLNQTSPRRKTPVLRRSPLFATDLVICQHLRQSQVLLTLVHNRILRFKRRLKACPQNDETPTHTIASTLGSQQLLHSPMVHSPSIGTTGNGQRLRSTPSTPHCAKDSDKVPGCLPANTSRKSSATKRRSSQLPICLLKKQ